jgi:hypothetical protein
MLAADVSHTLAARSFYAAPHSSNSSYRNGTALCSRTKNDTLWAKCAKRIAIPALTLPWLLYKVFNLKVDRILI